MVSRFTVVRTRNTEFTLVLLFMKAGNFSTYEIVLKCTVPLWHSFELKKAIVITIYLHVFFHTKNCKPTCAHPCIYVLKVGTARVFRNVSTYLRSSTASRTKTQHSSYFFIMLTEVTNIFFPAAQRCGCQHQSDIEHRPSEHPLHNHHHHHYCHRWRCSGKLWVF